MPNLVARPLSLLLAVLTLASALISVLASAGTSAGTGAAEPMPRYRVAFAQDTMANDWRAAQVREIRQVLDAHPDIEFRFSDANGDTAQQVRDIERFAAEGVDLLITSPRDGLLMREPIARVYRQGIPVILLTRRVEGDEFSQFISPDNRAIAAQAAAFLAERLGGQGNILMLQGVPSASSSIDRTQGFIDAIQAYPGLRLVAIKPADYLRAKTILRMEEALAEQLPFDAIYAQSDSMALGAIMALKRAGRDPASIPIVGIDYISEARAAIRAGELDVSFTFPTAGKEGAEAAIRLLRGESPAAKVVELESVKVTAETIDQVEPIF